MLDRLGLDRTMAETPDYVHLVVEATKHAFKVRDRYITDPAELKIDPQALLTRRRSSELAAKIDRKPAAAVGDRNQARRHHLDGRDRPQRTGGLVHSEHLPRVRQRRRAGRHRHRLAESGCIVPTRAATTAGVAAAEESRSIRSIRPPRA